METRGYTSAIQDFKRARRRAALEEITAHLTGKSADLLSYEEVRRKLKAREASPRVLREVPLDTIVGSVGRYSDFSRSFLPRRDSAKGRWASVKAAMTGLAGVPPIEVYQIGEVYFVKDGNHRVSVARELGASYIEAYVTEVRTKVPLSPDIQPDDLIVKAEYADFLEHTRLDTLRPEADLSMTVPGQYQVLTEHIDVHRYFLGLEQQREIPHEEAAVHWYDEYYLPVVRVIRGRGVLRDFPGRTETDLYVWTLEHRAALADELGWEIRPGPAAADLAAQFGTKPHHVVSRLSKRMLDAVTPDELHAGPPPGQWREERLSDHSSDCLFADILVAVTGTESGWHALEASLAVARREGARLHGLHVVPTERQQDSREPHAVKSEFERRCEEAGLAGRLAVEVGEVPHLICERSRLVDLVVLSLSYPYAPQPLARLGSGLRTIIRRCATPVLAVPGPAVRLERIMLAYDGSLKADEALFVAACLAGRRDIPLVVVTVMESGRTTPDTLTHAGNYLEQHGVQPTLVMESGPVGEVILFAAEEHGTDMIIMGGYGFSPIVEVAFGSTLEKVLRSSGRPILICR
jgi:nucleotide-binding universal stress UspA family protein